MADENNNDENDELRTIDEVIADTLREFDPYDPWSTLGSQQEDGGSGFQANAIDEEGNPVEVEVVVIIRSKPDINNENNEES